MIHYRKYQVKGENSTRSGKWYALPVINETIDIVQLVAHMADHDVSFSAGMIMDVVTRLIPCIKELLLAGKCVKLDDFAIFSVGIVSKGAASSEEFTVKKNISTLKLRTRAIGKLTHLRLNLEVQLKEACTSPCDTSAADDADGIGD